MLGLEGLRMSTQKEGGPAFPSPRWEGWGSPQEGMTLRDYFAAKAMPPMLHANAGRWAGNYAAYAKMAYEFADAMLEARKV